MSFTPPDSAHRPAFSFGGVVEVIGALLGAATLAGFLARLWWVFELATHFRPHLALGLAVLTVVWLVQRRWWRAAIGSALALLNALLVLAAIWPTRSPGTPSGTPLRLVSLNVHTDNQNHAAALKFLQNAEADVILVMEVNDTWLEALQPLRARYPAVVAQPREDNFGIALYSRLPLTNSAILELGSAAVPSLATTLTVGGQPVWLLGTHPLPPGSAAYARRRNEQLQQIAALVRRQTPPVIVLGDLNCTPWSPDFRELRRASGLKNAAARCGLVGSWPAAFPFGRLPLDHGLVSPAIRVLDKQTGPPVGSDHLPLIIDLIIPAQTGRRSNPAPDRETEASRPPPPVNPPGPAPLVELLRLPCFAGRVSLRVHF